MIASTGYRIAADLILAIHASFVVFVVLGLILVLIGGVRRWSWVRNPWFRAAHLVAIVYVVGQSWLGAVCPLTTFEMSLRERGGQVTYDETFVSHWVGEILYYDAPPWVFVAAYSLFGALVLTSWLLVRPRRFAWRRGAGETA